ncbi:Smr/MutS family protein, partial [Bacteroidota bacterium]
LYIIAEIDSIFAKAKYSTEIIGSFPSFNQDEPLRLLNSRHPLLLKRLNRENTVPLFLEIKDDRVILITGPNAGGKTVVLKTVGLIYLMALSGIHIPADPDSNLHFIDNILMDIGDRQSIEDDLSTFSSHLSNTKEIIERSGSKSFILLDEVGTGTDPAEGSAIAAAILITLRNKNAYVMATTHHGNLKLIANDLKGFQNAAMEFDNKNLKPTYVFKQGLPGSSYAFEVAERIGFEKEFTKLAKKYLDTNKTKVEEFLVDLENKSKELQSKLNNSELENSRLKGLANLYQTQISKLEKQKKEILIDAKKKADLYLSDVNKRVENAIKEIKESNADKAAIKEKRKKIEEVKIVHKDLFKEEIEETPSDYKYKVGDNVLVKNTATDGIISEIDTDKGEAVLTSGVIKLRVKINNLVLTKKKKAEPVSQPVISYTAQVANHRLDIRGKKPEDAEFEVIKFIDEAYASSLQNIEVLHGKGTGALKRMVHDILKKHESVKDYYHAHIEMGGDGITIIELK